MQIQTWLDKFNVELTLLGRAEDTKSCYCSFLKKFLIQFNDKHHPTHIGAEEIKKYLSEIESAVQYKQMLSVLLFFYAKVVKQPEKLKDIPYRKYHSKLPEIIDKKILLQRIARVTDPRYKAMFVRNKKSD